MRQTLIKSTLLWPLWALILLSYVAARPSPSSFIYWALAGTTVMALVAQMFGAFWQASEAQATIDSLAERLCALDVKIDLSDDDNNNVLVGFDGHQWETVFEELSRMPKGQRSLRAAIRRAHPYVLD